MDTIMQNKGGAIDGTEEFVQRLAELTAGDMAVLKRNAGNTIGQARGAVGLFYRIVPRTIAGGYQEEIYFLVATLSGLNKYTLNGDFGQTMAAVKRATGTESTDHRLAILLDSTFGVVEGGKPGGGELPYRLRQSVKLAASHEVGVDWAALLADLGRWSHPQRIIQKKWARSYFGTESQVAGKN